jgi:acyl carrier protein
MSNSIIAMPSDFEVTLAAIWAEVLELGGVGPDDNFFDLGADSMHAIEVVMRAREVGIRIEVPDLFATSSLAELAAAATRAE